MTRAAVAAVWGRVALVVLAGALFLPGIGWGLPSRRVDPFLFGDRRPWTGEEILKLAGPWRGGAGVGADVDLNPVDRSKEEVLNATDGERAEIVRRFRLFSYQPDEMITFRALAGMRPGKLELDPKLYQYGGLWVYPIGGLLKVFATVRSDLAYYLDRPEVFGRFYVIARAYSAIWGVVGALILYELARRLGASGWISFAAGVCFLVMPVVVNGAHEAKPHLAGAVLVLGAMLLGLRYARTGRMGDAVWAGVACGAALGMVLTSVVAFLVLPVMVVVRKEGWGRRARVLAVAAACGVGVYCLTNPYVVINAVRGRGALTSNVGNSTAMYHVGLSWEGVRTATWLLREGAGGAMVVAGVVGGAWLGVWSRFRVRREAWIVVAPAAGVLVYFVLLAAGKPGEYGRFAMVPDAALALAGVMGVGNLFKAKWAAGGVIGLLVLMELVVSLRYVGGYVADAGAVTGRLAAAGVVRGLIGRDGERLLVGAEPAPYDCPPVDLWRWKIVLPARGEAVRDYAVAVGVEDSRESATPLSWANVAVVIRENPGVRGGSVEKR